MAVRDPSAQELWVCDLGTVPYGDALAIQHALRAERQARRVPDVLLALEHPPVYTLGRRAAVAELPLGADFYRGKGIELHECDRGGRVTYHGPGQLVGYPIVLVDDVHAYVRGLEAAIVAALERERVCAHARAQDGPDYTGVWVGQRKIASIGVHVQRSVTTHGFAVNVCNELEPFEWVIACGLPDVRMTSLERELGAPASLSRFRALVVERFCETFGYRATHVPASALGIAAVAGEAITGRNAGRAPARAPLNPRTAAA